MVVVLVAVSRRVVAVLVLSCWFYGEVSHLYHLLTSALMDMTY